jgi:signal-transduction protein with cAMP-binding, CBS, and nucleotidyltransferase domain
MKTVEGESLLAPVTTVMDRNPIILDDSACINEAAREMEEKGVASILVKDCRTGLPTGIVTERDIVNRVVSKSLAIFKVSIAKIMITPLITAAKQTSCIKAIKIMREKSIRRLPILDHGNIIGIVTLMSLAGNLPLKNIDLLELEKPEISETPVLECPYCQSKFNDKMELSKHVDRIHLGSGLLEGDLRKWR